MSDRIVVGVVGGGQLARMMQQEAIPLGIDLRFLVESPDDPAARVSPRHVLGSALSGDDLRRFSTDVDVLTFDHEVVALATLAELEQEGHLLRPGAATVATVAHKARMRQALADAGLPIPPYRATTDPAEAERLVAAEGPQVIKLAQGGYDGRGTFFVDRPDEAARLVEATTTEVVIEPRLDLVAELAVLVVRRPGGEHVVYDPVTTVQVDGQCRRVDAPSHQPAAVLDSARSLALAAAEAVEVTGVLAVEMFLTRGGLLINELAARPHNSGHHTLGGAVTSQFQNHLRAVLDLPLGDTTLMAAAVVTANLIGTDSRTDPATRLAAALSTDPGARVHLYDKAPRADRKLGHVTICDDDHDRAVDRVRRVVEALGGQEVPR